MTPHDKRTDHPLRVGIGYAGYMQDHGVRYGLDSTAPPDRGPVADRAAKFAQIPGRRDEPEELCSRVPSTPRFDGPCG